MLRISLALTSVAIATQFLVGCADLPPTSYQVSGSEWQSMDCAALVTRDNELVQAISRLRADGGFEELRGDYQDQRRHVAKLRIQKGC